MKIAIISQSSPFVNETSALSGHTLDTYAGKLSTYTLAEKLSGNFYDLILLNIEHPFTHSQRLDFKGVELLYWLRLKFNIKAPVITYGFLSISEIMRTSGNPKNFI